MIKQSEFQATEQVAASERCAASSGVPKTIRDVPAAAIVVGFGAGLAVGCLVARGLIQAIMPRELSHAEQLGNAVMQALSGFLPTAVSKKFGI